MSDSTTDWPYRIRLADGTELAFRLDLLEKRLITKRKFDESQPVTAVDLARWLQSMGRAWLSGEIRPVEGEIYRCAIQVAAIAIIYDAAPLVATPELTPEMPALMPASAPLVFDATAFLDLPQPRPVLRRALIGHVDTVRIMEADLRMIRARIGRINSDDERFALAAAGWDDEQIAVNYADVASLLQPHVPGGAA